MNSEIFRCSLQAEWFQFIEANVADSGEFHTAFFGAFVSDKDICGGGIIVLINRVSFNCQLVVIAIRSIFTTHENNVARRERESSEVDGDMVRLICASLNWKAVVGCRVVQEELGIEQQYFVTCEQIILGVCDATVDGPGAFGNFQSDCLYTGAAANVLLPTVRNDEVLSADKLDSGERKAGVEDATVLKTQHFESAQCRIGWRFAGLKNSPQQRL